MKKLDNRVYSYFRFGWFESDVLGQTLQLKRIHQEGLSYRPKRPWGFFPRAEGLLREPFTDNAWTITSADGYRLYHQPATWWAVPLKRIPKHVRAAFIFQEDQRFAQHAGVDPRALVRAMAKTLTGKRQGASTIPMQVAKHCLLDYGTLPARRGLYGIIRKGRNMLLAWRLVHVEGREKILEYYLNHATMGPGDLRGIGPAAWSYFRKTPHELSLGEATQLAVLLRSPSRSVRVHQHRARYEAQRKTLLRRMFDAGAIDRSAYHKALRPPKIYPSGRRPIEIAMPQSVATAFPAIDPMLRQFDLGGTPQALRYRQPFPLHVRVSLHAELS